MRRIHLVSVLLTFVLGCANTATVPRSSSRSFVSSRNVLTRDEIRAHGSSNALAAIQSMRSWFLGRDRGRNQVPAVYVDGIRYIHYRDLAAIGIEDVHEIRYLSANEPSVPLGSPAGAIVITILRRQAAVTSMQRVRFEKPEES